MLLRNDVEISETSAVFRMNCEFGQDVPITVFRTCFPAFHHSGDLHPLSIHHLMVFMLLFRNHVFPDKRCQARCWLLMSTMTRIAIPQQSPLLMFVLNIPSQIKGRDYAAKIHR